MAHRVLRSFLDAYAVVAERLAARDPREPVEKDAFLDECRPSGASAAAAAAPRAESVSRELFAARCKLAANRDLVDPGGEELAARRRGVRRRGRPTRVRRIARDPRSSPREREPPAVP